MKAAKYVGIILGIASFGASAEALNEFLELFQGTPLVSEAQGEPVYVKPDIDKTCVELYLEITALLDQRNDARAGYWSDSKNQLAGAASTVFKPAVLYLGYSAIQHLQTTEASSEVGPRVRKLRTVSADKRCFVN